MWCQQNSCTHSQPWGKALCLFLEDLHRNGVRTDLSGSVPHLLLARPQLKGSLDPLHPCKVLPAELACKDASLCWGNSLACSFPPQLHQSTQIKLRVMKMTWASSSEGLCKHFQPYCWSHHLCDAQPRDRARLYQAFTWYNHITRSTRRRQRCEGISAAAGDADVMGKGRTAKRKECLKSIRMWLCFV